MIGCSPFKMTGMFFLQKRVEDLREQRKTVENQIATAEDSLQKTVDLIKELSDSKMVSFIHFSLYVIDYRQLTASKHTCSCKNDILLLFNVFELWLLFSGLKWSRYMLSSGLNTFKTLIRIGVTPVALFYIFSSSAGIRNTCCTAGWSKEWFDHKG